MSFQTFYPHATEITVLYNYNVKVYQFLLILLTTCLTYTVMKNETTMFFIDFLVYCIFLLTLYRPFSVQIEFFVATLQWKFLSMYSNFSAQYKFENKWWRVADQRKYCVNEDFYILNVFWLNMKNFTKLDDSDSFLEMYSAKISVHCRWFEILFVTCGYYSYFIQN